jgi:hypothetical protein
MDITSSRKTYSNGVWKIIVKMDAIIRDKADVGSEKGRPMTRRI